MQSQHLEVFLVEQFLKFDDIYVSNLCKLFWIVGKPLTNDHFTIVWNLEILNLYAIWMIAETPKLADWFQCFLSNRNCWCWFLYLQWNGSYDVSECFFRHQYQQSHPFCMFSVLFVLYVLCLKWQMKWLTKQNGLITKHPNLTSHAGIIKLTAYFIKRH